MPRLECSTCRLHVVSRSEGVHKLFEMGEHFKKMFAKHGDISPEEKAKKWVLFPNRPVYLRVLDADSL